MWADNLAVKALAEALEGFRQRVIRLWSGPAAAIFSPRGGLISGAGLLLNFNEGANPQSAEASSRSKGEKADEEEGGTPNITKLYRKYGPSLYWVCLRYTRNHEDAEDMVHQVFLKVHKNLGRFRGQSAVYTWMYRIAVNECIQLFRKRKPGPEAVPALEEEVRVFPEQALDAKLVLEKIVEDTDPKTMEILFLLYLEGLNQEEVATALNISRSTVNRKVADFKSKLDKFR